MRKLWAVEMDATSYSVVLASEGDAGVEVALFDEESDAKIFAEIKNFARYYGNR